MDKKGELSVHWSDEKPASNSILEFASSSFKKGYLPYSCNFISNTMMLTDICLC